MWRLSEGCKGLGPGPSDASSAGQDQRKGARRHRRSRQASMNKAHLRRSRCRVWGVTRRWILGQRSVVLPFFFSTCGAYRGGTTKGQ